MHHRSLAVFLVAIASLTLSDLASAQPRVRLFGKVVGEDGREIGGARVFLVSWPMPRRALGEVDRIEVVSTDRGRFEAMVLDGRAYTVWGQIAETGATVMTDVIETATAGKPLRLVAGTRWPRVRVQVRGREHWQGKQLQVHALATTRNLVEVELQLDDRGCTEVPPLPGAHGGLTIRSRDGLPIAVRDLDFGSDQALDIELARPLTIWVAVTSKATGQPLAGASITRQPGMMTSATLPRRRLPACEVGVTGETGRCSFILPEILATAQRERGRQQYLLVRAAGHAATWVSIGPPGDAMKEARQVSVALEAGSTLTGRILRPDGQPAAGAHLLLLTYAMADGDPGLHAGVAPLSIHCGPDGRFECHGLTRGDAFHLFALAYGLGLPAHATSPVHWLVRHSPAQTETTDLGDVALDRLCDLDLRVVRSDGAPATAARIEMQDRMVSAWIDHVADSKGSLRMLCPAGAATFGAFEVDGGVAIEEWQLTAGAQRQELRLSQPILVTGKVIDATGAPVAGAWVRLWNRPEGPDHTIKDLCFEQQNHQLMTEADGLFRLHAAGVAGDYRVRAGHKSAEGWTVSEEVPFTVDPERPSVPELRIVLPPASPTGPKK